jgi:hypothetical protein
MIELLYDLFWRKELGGNEWNAKNILRICLLFPYLGV